MRKLGFILLLAGFAWLSWDAWALRPIARAVYYREVSKLPDTRFSRDELAVKARDITFDAIDHIPSIFIPTCIMLTGGILLAFAQRSLKTHAP